MNTKRGFSLVELLVAVAIILIVMAIAIPNLLRSRMSANESSAVASMRTILQAQMSYASTYPDVGFTCNLPRLGPGAVRGPMSAGLIDETLSTGTKSGYNFVLGGCGALPSTTFALNATPTAPNRTGIRTFCSNESETVRVNPNGGPCGAGSPRLDQ